MLRNKLLSYGKSKTVKEYCEYAVILQGCLFVFL